MAEEYDVEVLLRGKSIQRIAVSSQGLSVGRATSNDLVLSDRTVSKIHARLSVQNERLMLHDLNSTEGTYLRGAKINSATLAPGDEVGVGPYTLKILRRGSQANLAQELSTPSVSRDDFSNLVRGLINLTRLVGITDLQAVLETLLEQSMGLVHGSRGFVVLVKGDRLSPILAYHGAGSSNEDNFSRTICQRAISAAEPVLLVDAGDGSILDGIASLARTKPVLVLGVPLIESGQILGILYLESEKLFPKALELQPELLKEVSALGGRALRVAMERRQIVSDQERWRWLAADLTEDADVFRGSRSPLMQRVLGIVERAAQEDVTVLIRGESGTGKDVTARAIHKLSTRWRGPFIAVNCGAIPKDLMEAELFGYEKGAFTGAVSRKLGRLELSHGGTLLLDEIGDMPKDLQVKLLRVLESRQFERLGSQESLKLDLRLLAATNRNLEDAVSQGDFREDLYYRLNVVSIAIPPLRERPEDIEPLVNEMLLMANRRFKRKLYGVTPEAVAALQAYRWPGNVRELRNVIDRAFILEPTDRITPASLPFDRNVAKDVTPTAPSAPSAPSAPEAPVLPLEEYLGRQEKDYIRLILDRAGGNVTVAARLLGLNRTALHKKLRRAGLRGSSPEADVPDEDESSPS